MASSVELSPRLPPGDELSKFSATRSTRLNHLRGPATRPNFAGHRNTEVEIGKAELSVGLSRVAMASRAVTYRRGATPRPSGPFKFGDTRNFEIAFDGARATLYVTCLQRVLGDYAPARGQVRRLITVMTRVHQFALIF
jgi:hypothetical protein